MVVQYEALLKARGRNRQIRELGEQQEKELKVKTHTSLSFADHIRINKR